MTLLSMVVALAAVLGGSNDKEAAEATLWAGHQVLHGERRVPVLGTLKTRMDTWILASWHRTERGFELRQRVCRLRFAQVAGVKVEMAGHRLPPTTMGFRRDSGQGDLTVWSEVKWGRDDVDGDGQPGATVRIEAPLCSGELHVSNRSVTWGRGRMQNGRFVGRQDVKVEQQVLGAEGMCLAMTAKDTDERVHGPFVYVPVAPESTCASLIEVGWPASAQ